MTERPVATRESELQGLLLGQHVLVEALVRHDAIGYHQLRQTLQEALAALAASTEVDEGALRPLRQLLESLDSRHRPVPPGEGRPPTDWLQVLR